MDDISRRRARNFLAPIFRLSDELLLFIFTINSHIQLSTFECEFYSPEPLYTTRATSQVCFHWRLLCLSSSELWSNVDMSEQRGEWLDEVLRRSSKSSIALRGWDGRNDTFARLLPRLRAFTGDIGKKEWTELIDEAQRPGSKLQSLILDLNAETEDEVLRVDQAPLHGLPLKHLALSSFDISNLDFSLFSNLSSLTLNTVQTLKASALLYELTKLPGLTELSLIDACDAAPPDLPIVVHLPNLTHLELGKHVNGYVDTRSLLPYLDIPATCVIIMNFEMLPSCYLTLVPLLSTRQFMSAGNRSVTLAQQSASMQFSNAPAGFQHMNDIDLRHSSVKIISPCNPVELQFWPRCVYDCVSFLFSPGSLFSSVTTLHLYAPGNFHHKDNMGPPFPLGIFKNITELFIASETLGWLLPVISNDQLGILFPSLKRVGLIIDGWQPYLDSLISYFAWRRELKAGIDALELRYPSSDESWNSYVTVAQCDKLKSLGITIDLFYVVDARYLLRTMFEQASLDSPLGYVYRLKSCEDWAYEVKHYEDWW